MFPVLIARMYGVLKSGDQNAEVWHNSMSRNGDCTRSGPAKDIHLVRFELSEAAIQASIYPLSTPALAGAAACDVRIGFKLKCHSKPKATTLIDGAEKKTQVF